MIKIAVDAMGGDYAPVETVKGGVDAVNASKEIKVLMVGDEEKIRKELAKYTYDQERIEVVGATEVIDNNEPLVPNRDDDDFLKNLDWKD